VRRVGRLSWWTFGPVVLGGGTFGGIGGTPALVGEGLALEAALATMDEAVELGVTMFDTAERYANGASESMIGRWLAERPTPVTQSVGITTKVAPAWMSGRDESFDTTFIAAAVAGSLTRLGVDGVELLMIHGPDDSTPLEDTLVALEALREAGQTAHVGACNLDAARLRAALDAADRLGVIGYEVLQNGYSLLTVDEDRDVQAICVERGLAYTAYSPLAGGVLSGKYSRHRPAPPNTRLALRPDGVDELLTPAMHDAIDRLRAAAVERGVSCGALALTWLTHHDAVTALISGPARSAPHLGLAAEALRVELSPKQHAEITAWFRHALHH
jgi:1-deoxyxylulose-5-phosphate synthase